MPVYLMGANPLHLNLIQGTLQAAGWRSDEIHLPPDVATLEAGLARQPQASLVLDLGSGEDSTPPAWLGRSRGAGAACRWCCCRPSAVKPC